MTTPSTPDVVIGEMRPWSDRKEGSSPAGGPVLAELVRTLTGANVLVLGPTQDAIVDILASRANRVDVLVRSTTDAETIRDTFGDRVIVTVGGLEGYAPAQDGVFDAVVALDGLDRVLSFEAPPTAWPDVLASALDLLADDGLLVLTHPLGLSPLTILDARPATDRRGDDDFHPFEVDSHRPLDSSWLTSTLSASGLSIQAEHLLFGPASAPRMAWNMTCSEHQAAFSVPLRAALRAQQTVRVPLLADPQEATSAYFAAGRPQDAADALYVVAGRRAAHEVSTAPALVVGDADVVLAADHDANTREWVLRRLDSMTQPDVRWPDAEVEQPLVRDTAQPSETHRFVKHPSPGEATGVVAAADLLPDRVSDGPSVGEELRRLAALGDVPAFRELAARAGDFVVSQPAAKHRVFDFDDLHLSPNGVSIGLSALAWTSPASSEEALAAAWFTFSDDLVEHHRRHPWPRWVMGEPNVASWLEAAGASSDTSVLDRGRELADELRHARRRDVDIVPSLREALAAAQSAEREVMELKGHVAGLERTIGFRDQQLKTRADVIRKLRGAPASSAAVVAPTSIARLAKRTAQVRSFDELTSGVNRVTRRARRKLGK